MHKQSHYSLDTLSDINACLGLNIFNLSDVSTVKVNDSASSLKVAKRKGSTVYAMTDSGVIPASFDGWQSCSTFGSSAAL